MTMLARNSITKKRARHACIKIKMNKRHQAQTPDDIQIPSIPTTLITLSCLIAIFTIIAYFRPH